MSKWMRTVVLAAMALLAAAAARSLAAGPPAFLSEGYQQFLPVIMRRAADWQLVDSGLEATLTEAFFVNESTGWVVGKAGVIARTDDGGRSWVPQQSGTESDLLDVSFDSDGHGWAVGDEIVHTIDGGQTWQVMPSPVPTTTWRAVQFLDSDHGWIVGGHYVWDYYWTGVTIVWNYGFVLRTSDGGQSWLKSEDLACRAVDVQFLDPQQGFVVSRCSHADWWPTTSIERSTDGGATWESVPLPEGASEGGLEAITFPDSAHGWAAGWAAYGAPGRILSTSDGGLTWSVGGSGTSATWLDVQFVSPSLGWVLSESAIHRTADGGQTWAAETLDAPGQGLAGLRFLDAEHGWALGTEGAVYIRR